MTVDKATVLHGKRDGCTVDLCIDNDGQDMPEICNWKWSNHK